MYSYANRRVDDVNTVDDLKGTEYLSKTALFNLYGCRGNEATSTEEIFEHAHSDHRFR